MATASPTQSTAGISPKAPAAGGAVAGSGLLASLVNLIAVGHFDTTSIILALSGSAGGLIAYAAAYIAKPGPVHTIIADAEAAVVAVEHADPSLVSLAKHIESVVKAEIAKLPAGLDPLVHVGEDHAVDPILADFPETDNPPVLGDAGVAHVDPPAPADPPTPVDPKDAQIANLTAERYADIAVIADLQAQLAAIQPPVNANPSAIS